MFELIAGYPLDIQPRKNQLVKGMEKMIYYKEASCRIG